VLNNKGDENKISQDTQQRIIAYAKKHNYVPNQLARGLSRGKTETIGLIIPNISDTFYSEIAGRVEARAMEMGYTVIFSSSYERPEKESKLIQSMLNRQVDGLIIASTQENQEEIKYLQKSKFPFVLIDRHYPKISTNYVVVDNFGGIHKATWHLLSLNRKRVGFVTIKSELEAMKQRFLGYQYAIKDFGGAQTDMFVEFLDHKKFEDQMEEAIRNLVFSSNNADAIIFSTHYLARVGIRTLKNLKVKIPQEVAIASFSEMASFDLVDPPITSVLQPIREIGNTAVDILVDEMEGKNTIKQVDKKRILETEFVIRKSCGS
jgi:LacI family transcriptional regulator